MVKHVIIWNLKEEFNTEEIKKNMKTNLEGLKGKVPGLVDINIIIDKLPSSTGDVMLDSVLESEEALKGYAVHPDHVKVADTYVRPYTATRACIDYEV